LYLAAAHFSRHCPALVRRQFPLGRLRGLRGTAKMGCGEIKSAVIHKKGPMPIEFRLTPGTIDSILELAHNLYFMRKIGISLLAAGTLALPALASAATILNTLALANTVLNAMIGLFITLAIVIFFWGLIRYLTAVGEEKSAGLQIMFYGVLAIFVMVSIWGIIRLLQSTFSVTSTSPVIPQGIQINTNTTSL
jgi:hypothetical protein